MSILFSVPVPQPARRLAPETIGSRFDAARDLRARVGRLAAAVDAKFAAIDPRYTAAARAQEERRLRDGFQEDVAPLGAKLGEIVVEFEGQLEHYTPAAVRARATHGDKVDKVDDSLSLQLASFWLARLAAAQPWELVEIARKAASEYDHALAVRVDAEVRRRGLTGDDAALALGLCASIPIPPGDRETAGKLDVGITTCQLALNEIQELVAGASRLEKRLEIALAASARSRALNPKGQPGAAEATTEAAAESLGVALSGKVSGS